MTNGDKSLKRHHFPPLVPHLPNSSPYHYITLTRFHDGVHVTMRSLISSSPQFQSLAHRGFPSGTLVSDPSATSLPGFRRLLPASEPSPESANKGSAASSENGLLSPGPRATLTKIACERCRKRKIKVRMYANVLISFANRYDLRSAVGSVRHASLALGKVLNALTRPTNFCQSGSANMTR
jgi:hypothetical protein